MKGKPSNKIFVASILLVMLMPTTVSGSHLGSSLHTAGPPQLHQPRQIRKQAPPLQKSRVSLPTSKNTFKDTFGVSSLTKPYPHLKATEQKKQLPKPHTKLGWRFLLKEQPQSAIAAYQKAIKQNPKSAKAYLGLGISLKQLGKVELAKKALLKAVSLDPSLPPALVHLGYLYAEGHLGQPDLLKARGLFKKASQLGDPFAAIALLELKSRSKI